MQKSAAPARPGTGAKKNARTENKAQLHAEVSSHDCRWFAYYVSLVRRKAIYDRLWTRMRRP